MLIDPDALIAAVESDDNIGFCIACGAEQHGCEPDMQEGTCETCDEKKVYGAEELLIMGYGS